MEEYKTIRITKETHEKLKEIMKLEKQKNLTQTAHTLCALYFKVCAKVMHIAQKISYNNIQIQEIKTRIEDLEKKMD